MTDLPHFDWDNVLKELSDLDDRDVGRLASLALHVHQALDPQANIEPCLGQLRFLSFEARELGANHPVEERGEILRALIFDVKKFAPTGARLGAAESDVLMRDVLRKRTGHPLLIAFLVVHLGRALDLPLNLLRARHHYLLKWMRPGKTTYLDLFNSGRALEPQQLITVVSRTGSKLETIGARALLTMYLEVLGRALENGGDDHKLLGVFDLRLRIDEMNVDVLGRRALLRQRLGCDRGARADLKRYFSFVDSREAPAELKAAWRALEAASAPVGAPDLLH